MQITLTQKEFVKILKKKKLGKYNDLYIQGNTLLPADVFNNSQNIILNYMKPAIINSKLTNHYNLLTDIDML